MLLLTAPCASWAQTITSFTPISGQPGNVITINGSGFSTATQVEFNNVNPVLADFIIISSSQLQTVAPEGATTGPLVVISGGTSATSSSSFTVAPVIYSFSPAAGTSPTVVTIQGANFVTTGTYVQFTGVSTAVKGTVEAATEVTAAIPSGATTGPITVYTSAGTNSSATNFTVSSGPSISGFSPTEGPIGTSVTIMGANFFSPSVTFNGVGASVTSVSTTEIIATVPNSASTGPIKVATSSGSVTTSSNFFTGSGPLITGFSPAIAATNTAVTITGYNLASLTSVTINGKKGTIVSDQATEVQVYVPWRAATGPIEVFGSSTFTTSTNFIVTGGPYVTDFSPGIGAVGQIVTINGVNFSGTPTVKFDAAAAVSPTLVSSTQISATVPNGATTGPITVTIDGSSSTTSTNFVVTGAGPDITGFSPSNGVRGMTVTINGGNFQNVKGVTFNGVAATGVTATSTTVVTATVPPTATTGPIAVTTSGGTATTAGYFYLQPWITALNTNAGIVNATIDISGRNLTNATSVQIGGVNYTFSNVGTEIAANIPSNAITGSLVITTPGGVIISANVFDILPKIYSFTPVIGPSGTVVTISGTSLFEVTSAEFGGAAAAINNVNTNELQATVPANAVTGPITVLSPYGNSISSNNFTATKQSLLLLTKTVNPSFAGPGTNVTYTLQVTNEGPSIVTGVIVTDNIPANFTYKSSSGTVGSGGLSNGVVIWNFGMLTNDTSASFQVVGTAGLGTVTNTANLGFNEGNLNADNDFAYAYAYFINAADRTLSLSALSSPPGLLLTWPQSGAGFQLQVSTNLANPNGWETVAATSVSNGFNIYSNTFNSADAFYRLEAP